MTETVIITDKGQVVGTYRGSAKAIERAISLFVFNHEPNIEDGPEIMRDDRLDAWEQVATECGLRFEKPTKFDLWTSDCLER